MLLPAPLRFSTMNCWPKRWLSACASTRAAMSPEAPAAKAGCEGQESTARKCHGVRWRKEGRRRGAFCLECCIGGREEQLGGSCGEKSTRRRDAKLKNCLDISHASWKKL